MSAFLVLDRAEAQFKPLIFSESEFLTKEAQLRKEYNVIRFKDQVRDDGRSVLLETDHVLRNIKIKGLGEHATMLFNGSNGNTDVTLVSYGRFNQSIKVINFTAEPMTQSTYGNMLFNLLLNDRITLGLRPRALAVTKLTGLLDTLHKRHTLDFNGEQLTATINPHQRTIKFVKGKRSKFVILDMPHSLPITI